ncbi:hypothetical protein LVD15_26610 [Fulvivirga maritima]|uniref:hypothetical protein n=1 Tax=Fulvivirga maritima TaxID=2904247 RepID=UPI001F2EBBED|nr:hypothetical protein [Fulvivirga maritima]UII26823.1 hypothetical protein LVD15_26610 [Fulvivirga maritima]
MNVQCHLSKIDLILNDLLRVTRSEFLYICNYVKIYISMLAGAKRHERLVFRIVEELQYLDLLTQKVDHIKQIHAKININDPKLINEDSPDKSWSVFELSRLQVEVAVVRLQEKLEKINGMLEQIDPTFTIRKEFMDVVAMYSKNLKENLDIICDQCHKYQFLNIQQEKEMLYKLYSTMSERMVLDMYLGNSEITTEEIVASLRQGIGSTSSVDFF